MDADAGRWCEFRDEIEACQMGIEMLRQPEPIIHAFDIRFAGIDRKQQILVHDRPPFAPLLFSNGS